MLYSYRYYRINFLFKKHLPHSNTSKLVELYRLSQFGIFSSWFSQTKQHPFWTVKLGFSIVISPHLLSLVSQRRKRPALCGQFCPPTAIAMVQRRARKSAKSASISRLDGTAIGQTLSTPSMCSTLGSAKCLTSCNQAWHGGPIVEIAWDCVQVFQGSFKAVEGIVFECFWSSFWSWQAVSVDFWIARCGNFLDAQTVTVRSQQQLCGCASNILYQVQTVTQAECNEWSPLKKWAIDCPLPSLFSIMILPKGAQDDQKHFPTGFHTAQASLLHFQRENPIDLHLERPTFENQALQLDARFLFRSQREYGRSQCSQWASELAQPVGESHLTSPLTLQIDRSKFRMSWNELQWLFAI